MNSLQSQLLMLADAYFLYTVKKLQVGPIKEEKNISEISLEKKDPLAAHHSAQLPLVT